LEYLIGYLAVGVIVALVYGAAVSGEPDIGATACIGLFWPIAAFIGASYAAGKLGRSVRKLWQRV
jgi:hypothetical protein